MSFPVHTIETAPHDATETLQAMENRYGFIPNLAGVFAESPGAFKGLLSAMQAFDDDVLTLQPVERQIILIAVAVENSCNYCVAAHSMLANKSGLPRDQIDRLHRQESLDDARLDALRSFATEVVKCRGRIDQAQLDGFLAAGFTSGQVFEVLLGVSLKTLTNYANHIAKPPVNAQFREFLPDWEHAA